VSTRKRKRNRQTFLNSAEAAKYLGISRQYFYVIQRKHQLKPYKRDGIICQWSLQQLASIKGYLKRPRDE
jgi:hypothetical protein